MPVPMPSNEPASGGPAEAGGVVCSTGSPLTTLDGGGAAVAVVWPGSLACWCWVLVAMPCSLLSGRDLSCWMARMTLGFGPEDASAGVAVMAPPRIETRTAAAAPAANLARAEIPGCRPKSSGL